MRVKRQSYWFIKLIKGFKMKIKFILCLLILTSFVYAQSSTEMARLEYDRCNDLFNSLKYSEVIKGLNKIEKLLGSTNMMVEYLRVKTYYKMGQYNKVASSVEKYFRQTRSNKDLDAEVYDLKVKSEEKIKYLNSPEYNLKQIRDILHNYLVTRIRKRIKKDGTNVKYDVHINNSEIEVNYNGEYGYAKYGGGIVKTDKKKGKLSFSINSIVGVIYDKYVSNSVFSYFNNDGALIFKLNKEVKLDFEHTQYQLPGGGAGGYTSGPKMLKEVKLVTNRKISSLILNKLNKLISEH